MKVLFIFTILLSLVSSGFMISSCYTYDTKVDSLIERTQVSADREDMREHLSMLRDNMRELGWDTGHFAVLWKTPENDLALHYKAVERLIERLDEISHLSKSNVAYQTALDDIRGTVRELENPGDSMLVVKYWPLLLLLGGLWTFLFVYFSYEYP